MQSQMSRSPWQVPTLANIKDQEMGLRMSAKSAAGREKAVERILVDVSFLLCLALGHIRRDEEDLANELGLHSIAYRGI
jgi:hypothetical protein